MPRAGDRPNGNVARGDATREHLVSVATTVFGLQGYEGTSIDAVLNSAGTSRGSLYHHFKSKGALFEAVFESIEEQVGADVAAAAASASDPVEALRLGGRRWILLVGDPTVRRVLLIDAPSVLGWERWRELEERHALGLVKAVLEAIAAQGLLPAPQVDLMAHVLLAAVNEIALHVAQSAHPRSAMRAGLEALDLVLDRLFASPGP